MATFHRLFEQLEGILYGSGLPPNFETLHKLAVEELWRMAEFEPAQTGPLSEEEEEKVVDLATSLIYLILPKKVIKIVNNDMDILQDKVSDLVTPLYRELIRDPALVQRARERNI